MPELEPPGVEHLTLRNRIKLLVERRLPVNRVADHRTPERGHVHADLMRAPGLDPALD